MLVCCYCWVAVQFCWWTIGIWTELLPIQIYWLWLYSCHDMNIYSTSWMYFHTYSWINCFVIGGEASHLFSPHLSSSYRNFAVTDKGTGELVLAGNFVLDESISITRVYRLEDLHWWLSDLWHLQCWFQPVSKSVPEIAGCLLIHLWHLLPDCQLLSYQFDNIFKPSRWRSSWKFMLLLCYVRDV